MRRKDREVTEKAALYALLETMQVCHVGLVDGDKPYVVPLNFGFVWEKEQPTVYFHAAKQGRKLDILAQNPHVCLQWDAEHVLEPGAQAAACTYRYVSLIGHGVAEIVTDDAEKLAGLTALMKQYGQAQSTFPEKAVAQTCVIKVTLSSLTGKVNRQKHD